MHVVNCLFAGLSVSRPGILLTGIGAEIFHLLGVGGFEGFGWRHFLLTWGVLIDHRAQADVSFEVEQGDRLA